MDWCPRTFVKSNMVDPDVARKWLEEVQKQQEMDTPRTKARKRAGTTALSPQKRKKSNNWIRRLTTTLNLTKTQQLLTRHRRPHTTPPLKMDAVPWVPRKNKLWTLVF